VFPTSLARGRVDRPKRGELIVSFDQTPAAARNAYTQTDWLRRLSRLPDGAGFMGRHEEQSPVWVERRRLEVGAAVIVRQALLRGADVVKDDRPAVGANLLGPV